MEKFTARSIFKSIAIGKILYYEKQESTVKRIKISNVEAELEKFENVKKAAIEELALLYEKACKEVGELNAAVFEVHMMMIEDEDYNESVINMITQQEVNAEYAVAVTGDNFSQMFSEMEDEYFKARSIDVIDISNRLITILCGQGNRMFDLPEPVILVAKDLAPSETVQMDKSKMLGFVTELGSTNSHTAILARTMGIPALIGVSIQKEWDGLTAIIDGITGEFIINPDPDCLKQYQEKQKQIMTEHELLLELKGKEDITRKGHSIKLFANIGNVSDVASVLKNDATGIGLFRSEFLYLEQDHLPTEEEQFYAYKTVAERMAGKKVIIRTLDIGADKQVDYFPLEHEENPAMGYRAIRICLTQKDIFKTQLRALFRASKYGNIAIMYPMIISVDEVRKIKEIVSEVKGELIEENLPFNQVEEGIMIETPAAALISDELSKEVDFFSIGTNDLTQYTLAIDRQNARLDNMYDPHHPAILRLIQMIIDNGHKNNCWGRPLKASLTNIK